MYGGCTEDFIDDIFCPLEVLLSELLETIRAGEVSVLEETLALLQAELGESSARGGVE
jgi:N-dimethylarginine dimethylaminohydrolase